MFFKKLAEDLKIITVKYPTLSDNSDWKYIITHKNNVKKVSEILKNGTKKELEQLNSNLITYGETNAN